MIFFSDPPIDRWRNGYLWVTHLCSQLWCEQQMEYGFTRKHELPKEDPKHVVRGLVQFPNFAVLGPFVL